MTNVLSIIQVRMDSSRLPEKAMLEIVGKPILEHIINFLEFSKQTDQIIVATTTHKSDDVIEKLCSRLKITCYRGSFDDALGRFYECAKLFHGDIIVRLTADNPLIDPELVDEVINTCIDTKCDYATNMLSNTFPHHGYLVEAMPFKILEKLYKTKKDHLNKEHITYELRMNPELYHSQYIKTSENFARPTWRLTVDYKEDFELISKIFLKLYNPKSFIKYESVVKFLDKNQDLLKINSMHNK